MSRYYDDDHSGAPLAAGAAVAFLILAGATATAFFAVSEGVFEPAPTAHLYAFAEERTVSSAAGAPQAASSISPGALPAPSSAAQQVDMMETAAVEPEVAEAPLCDIAACGAAYRSFRASDCTFQPYDGPRRLCTR